MPTKRSEGFNKKNENEIGNPSILPDSFGLPDLSLGEKEYFRNEEVHFLIIHMGREWPCKVSFQLDQSDNSIGIMRFNIYDPDDKQKRIVNFASRLWKDDSSIMSGKYTNSRGSSCQIYNRKVEDVNARKKGLGTLSLRVTEEIVSRINEKYPEYRMDSLCVFTRLGVLAKMLKKSGYNPHALDENAAEKLLQLETSDIKELKRDHDEVLFMKSIFSN